MPSAQRTILIIEDEDAAFRLLKLAFHGHQCIQVARIGEGKEVLQQGGIDGAVLDLGLANGSGEQTLAEFADFVENVPFIVYTARRDEELAMLAVSRYGMENYLVKGMHSEEEVMRQTLFAIERRVRRNHQAQKFAQLRGMLKEAQSELASLSGGVR